MESAQNRYVLEERNKKEEKKKKSNCLSRGENNKPIKKFDEHIHRQVGKFGNRCVSRTVLLFDSRFSRKHVSFCLFFSRRSLEMLPDVAYKKTTMDVYFTQIIMASKTEQKQPMKVGESNQK